MQIYSAVVLNNPTLFGEKVSKAFPNDNLQISPTAWLLAGYGTAQEICGKLGLPTAPGAAPVGTSVVLTAVSGYYGLASSNIWEWIAAKQAAQ